MAIDLVASGIQVASSLLGGLFKQDNSEHWNENDWGWWLEKDAATHPIQNYLIFLYNNPSFFKKWPEKVSISKARAMREGWSDQLDAVLKQQGLSTTSGGLGSVLDSITNRSASALDAAKKAVLGDIAADNGNSGSLMKWVLIGLAAFFGIKLLTGKKAF